MNSPNQNSANASVPVAGTGISGLDTECDSDLETGDPEDLEVPQSKLGEI